MAENLKSWKIIDFLTDGAVNELDVVYGYVSSEPWLHDCFHDEEEVSLKTYIDCSLYPLIPLVTSNVPELEQKNVTIMIQVATRNIIVKHNSDWMGCIAWQEQKSRIKIIQVVTLYNQSSEKDRLPDLPQSGYWGGLWKYQCQSRTCDTRTASDTEVLNWGILETGVELCLPSLALTLPRICNDLESEIIGSTQQQLQRTRKFTY